MRPFLHWVLPVLILVVSCTRLETLGWGEKRQLTVYESEQHAAFPCAAQLKTGEILAVFREGGGHVSPDGKIMKVLSTSHGRRWSKPDTLFSAARDCRDPSVVQLRDGTILVNFFESAYDGSGRLLGAIGCFVSRSFDNGRTFISPRIALFDSLDWSATSDAVLETARGALIMPVYGAKRGGKSSAFAAFSYDQGETWSELVCMARDDSGKVDFQEPALLECASGKLICIMRTDGAEGFLYRTCSEDGGKTWTVPERTSMQGEAPDLYAAPDGILVCAYRDFWPRGTSLSRSYDQGITWEEEMQIAGCEGDCAYPSLISLGENVLAFYYQVLPQGSGEKKSAILGTRFSLRRPAMPEGFSGSADGKGWVHLRWNRVPGARYYLVYRDITDAFETQPGYPFQGNAVASPVFNSYVDREASSGMTVYYRISAVSGSGKLMPGSGSESLPTEPLSVRVPKKE